MKIYIVTPTFNALQWLPQCIRSVADQACEAVEVHHHVQDGGSTDGTPAWLAEWQKAHRDAPHYTFTYESAKDKGMYDAINIAWSKLPADADMTAHLNSDEQYAPGALAAVAAAALKKRKVDVFLTAYLILDAEGGYICHRRPVPPRKWSSRLTCELMTCATFHRAEPFRRHGVRFDTRYRSLADLVFYRDLVELGPEIACLPSLITTFFTVTGANLAWTKTSAIEWQEYSRNCLSPTQRKHVRKAIYRVNGLRRIIDFFCRAPRSFALYRKGDTERTQRPILHPTPMWRMRTKSAE